MMGETGPSIVALAQMQQGCLLLASLKAKALKNNDLETQEGTSTVPGGKRETKNSAIDCRESQQRKYSSNP